MMSTGLTIEQIDVLVRIFIKYPEIEVVKLYGSRAKGTFNSRSDVDLVVFGEGIDRFLLSNMLLDLDDSNLPYSVDLQNYSEIKNRALIDHIERVGIPIFKQVE